MHDRGIKGSLYFWLRKQVMNFNDGTFSWYQEGYFQAWDYPDITDSCWKQSLRDFYWLDGKDYIWFTTLSQGIWIFVLTGIVMGTLQVAITTSYRLWKKKQTEEVKHGIF